MYSILISSYSYYEKMVRCTRRLMLQLEDIS